MNIYTKIKYTHDMHLNDSMQESYFLISSIHKIMQWNAKTVQFMSNNDYYYTNGNVEDFMNKLQKESHNIKFADKMDTILND